MAAKYNGAECKQTVECSQTAGAGCSQEVERGHEKGCGCSQRLWVVREHSIVTVQGGVLSTVTEQRVITQ